MCGALILTFKNQSPAKTLKSKLTFKDIEGNLFFSGFPPTTTLPAMELGRDIFAHFWTPMAELLLSQALC